MWERILLGGTHSRLVCTRCTCGTVAVQQPGMARRLPTEDTMAMPAALQDTIYALLHAEVNGAEFAEVVAAADAPTLLHVYAEVAANWSATASVDHMFRFHALQAELLRRIGA